MVRLRTLCTWYQLPLAFQFTAKMLLLYCPFHVYTKVNMHSKIGENALSEVRERSILEWEEGC